MKMKIFDLPLKEFLVEREKKCQEAFKILRPDALGLAYFRMLWEVQWYNHNYQLDRSEKEIRKKIDLKEVLMHVGNKLVAGHGFLPAGGRFDLNYPTTSPLVEAAEFFNDNLEARMILEEFGLKWSM